MTIALRSAFILIFVLAPVAVHAQVAAQNPPVRKSKAGICFPPENSDYRRIHDFIPFKTMADCLKSGGILPPKR